MSKERFSSEPSGAPRLPNEDLEFTSDGEGWALGEDATRALRDALARWRTEKVAKSYERVPARQRSFETWSGLEVPDVATLVTKLKTEAKVI